MDSYTPSLLFPIARAEARAQLESQSAVFVGEDVWTGYEFSWLDLQGKPHVSGLRLRVAAASPAIVESKSMKLYLASFAQTKFETQSEVLNTLDQDLSLAFRAPVQVELLTLAQMSQVVPQMPGRCLDELDVAFLKYEPHPDYLAVAASQTEVHESLHTHLFRSVCPVTGQPDWASIAIDYRGLALDDVGLLRYLVSYRAHAGFHEAVIEQIFCDIVERCAPQSLSVYGRFQRRGGLDINPFRSTHEASAPLYRLARQ